MTKAILINKVINKFKKKITVSADKSLSIRFAILASQAIGKSKAYNLLRSEDVISTLTCLKKLGVKIKLTKKKCERFAGSRRMADPNAMHDTTSSTRAANRKEKFLQIYYSFIVLFVGFLVYKLMVKNKLL